jgi:hypothetical protein
LGGQTSIRPYWRCYYADTKAVVYVVDSTDRERLNINKAELLAMMNEEELQDAKLLVFANKQVRAGPRGVGRVHCSFRHSCPCTGSTRRDDSGRSVRRARARYAQEPAMEHLQVVRHQGRRARGGSRLASPLFPRHAPSYCRLNSASCRYRTGLRQHCKASEGCARAMFFFPHLAFYHSCSPSLSLMYLYRRPHAALLRTLPPT